MTEIVRYENATTGIVVKVVKADDGLYELVVTEHGRRVNGELYGTTDEDWALSAANGRAMRLDAVKVEQVKIMTSPLTTTDQIRSTVPAGTSQDLTCAQENALKQATLAGYVTRDRQYSVATLRALADRGWLELDYHRAVPTRVEGGFITPAGERRMRRGTLAVVR